MKLLLLRHGIAADDSPDGTDAARPLTDEGVCKTTEACAGLAQLLDTAPVILTSPKQRARQTAHIAAAALGSSVKVMNLLADDEPERIIAVIGKQDDETLMLVGHEPTFSRIIELLLTPAASGGFVQMKKAGCACIEVEWLPGGEPRGTLMWLATPAMLRAIAR